MLFATDKSKHDKFSGYNELLAAFKLDGCAICQIVKSSSQKYIESLLFEKITEAQTIQKIRSSYGFCAAHSQLLIKTGDALGNSLIFKGVLLELLNNLYHSNLDKFSKRSGCLACAAAEKEVERTANIFYHFYKEDEFICEFQKSNGLCLNHFLFIYNKLDDETLKDKLAKFHIEKIKYLIGHLDELIRKHDSQFTGEKISPDETKAWLKAIKFTSGIT